jgi:hypothetical protein
MFPLTMEIDRANVRVMELKGDRRHSDRRGRWLVLMVGLLTLGQGAPSILAAVPGASIQAQVAPIFCDTENIDLNHRYSPIGHVDLDTGAYVFDIVDIGDPGSGSRLFTRSYHSLDTRATLLGRGWSNNFDVRIRRYSPPSNDLNFTGPDGWVHRFPGASLTNEIVLSSTTSARLARTDDAGFVVLYERFEWTMNSVGSLIRVDYPDGGWVSVEYDGRRLSRSVGPTGPELAFDVVPTNSGDRLARVSDTTGLQGSVDFEFDDDGRLIREAPSDGAARRYAYWGRSERIATIADDKNAVLIAAEYDTRGRVVRLQDAEGLADGQAEIFTYENFPDGTMRTTVTYPVSRVEPDWNPVQIVTHDVFHRVTEEQLQPRSTVTFVGRYVYDSDNQRVAVDEPCPALGTAVPMDDPIVGPLTVLLLAFARVLTFIASLLQLLADEFMLTIPI